MEMAPGCTNLPCMVPGPGELSSTRRAGRPRSPEHDEAILDAALRLLARDGFARMSMDAIAAEAGVSKATLYLRYGSKSDVATAAMARLRAANEPVATGDMRADLVARLQRVLAYAEVPSVMPLVGTCLAEEHQTPELLRLFRERSVAPRRAAVRGILVTAQERGELPGGLDVEPVIDVLMGCYQARYLAGGPFPDRWAERVVDTVLNGLLPRD